MAKKIENIEEDKTEIKRLGYQFMVYPDRELRLRLDEIAGEEGRSLSGLAVHILKQFVASYGKDEI